MHYLDVFPLYLFFGNVFDQVLMSNTTNFEMNGRYMIHMYTLLEKSNWVKPSNAIPHIWMNRNRIYAIRNVQTYCMCRVDVAIIFCRNYLYETYIHKWWHKLFLISYWFYIGEYVDHAYEDLKAINILETKKVLHTINSIWKCAKHSLKEHKRGWEGQKSTMSY